jgi:hypothetical protein
MSADLPIEAEVRIAKPDGMADESDEEQCAVTAVRAGQIGYRKKI